MLENDDIRRFTSDALDSAQVARGTLPALAEHSSDAVICQTPEGIISGWNASAEQLFGYPAAEVIGRHVSILSAAESRGEQERIAERVKGGEVVRISSAERVCKNGRRLFVSLAVIPCRAPDGRIIGMTQIAHDLTEQSRAEQARRTSRENLLTVLNSVLDGIVLHTADGRVLDANDTWCSMHGITVQQARTLSIADLSCGAIPPEESKRIWAGVLAGQPAFLECKMRRVSDGTQFEAEVHWQRVRFDGHFVIMANVRDVTQQKDYEEQARVQSEALRCAANAIVITGRDGNVQWVNPAFTRLTGYTADEILTKNTRVLKSGLERPEFYRAMWKTILTGHVWRGELVNKRKDGNLYTEEMTITPVSDAGGEISHFIAIKQDVSERKRREQALRENEHRLRAMFENAGVGIVEVTGDDHFLAANSRACEILGRSVEELERMTIHELTWPADRELSDRLNAELHAGVRERVTYEKRYLRGDGSPVWVNVNVSAVRDDKGKWVRSITTIEDITERKNAEAAASQAREQLSEANAQLEAKIQERTAQLVEANANLQTFAYTAAHDLRSPLRSIMSFSTLALMECGERLGPEGQAHLQRVVQSADQMGHLLNDLLEYSRLNEAELRLEKVELGKAVEEALNLVGDDVGNKGAQVSVQKPLPVIVGHPATTILVITNFISNALKFVSAGVRPIIRIGAEACGDYLRLWVSDNGIGIKPEDQEKLFQMFQRLHGKTTYPGTGLGLAIVRRAAERMGGRVGLESEYGKGSRFWVELRRA